MTDTLREQLSEPIEVVLGGKRTVVTKMQAAIRRLIDKSIAGDMSAFRVLAVLAQVLNESPNVSGAELEELDNKVLATLFKNYSPESSS